MLGYTNETIGIS